MTFVTVRADALKWNVSVSLKSQNSSMTHQRNLNHNTLLLVNNLLILVVKFLVVVNIGCNDWPVTSERCLVFRNQSYPVVLISPSADNSNVRTVKTEGPSLVKTCIFDGQIKSLSSERTDCSSQPSKRQEDTPMEVSSNPPATDVFKVSQQTFSRKRNQNIYFRIVVGNIFVFSLSLALLWPSRLSAADPGAQF